MKFQTLIGLCLLALVSAPMVARADVCDQASGKRIHVILMPNGNLGFIEDTPHACNLVGPETTFTWDELSAKYLAAKAIVRKSHFEHAGDAIKVIGLIALFSGSGDEGRMVAATHSSPNFSSDADNEDNLPLALAIVDALESKRLQPDKCTEVKDYESYKATLIEQLNEIANARPPAPPMPQNKKSDLAGVKHVSGQSSQTKAGNTGPQSGQTQPQ